MLRGSLNMTIWRDPAKVTVLNVPVKNLRRPENEHRDVGESRNLNPTQSNRGRKEGWLGKSHPSLKKEIKWNFKKLS